MKLNILKFLAQSYIFVMVVALFAGLFIPAMNYLVPLNTLLLQIIFFLSCLKIDIQQLKKSVKDWRFLLLANLMMLVGFPILVWVFVQSFGDVGLALFLLAAMPAGMTAPLLVDVVGGNQSSALTLTVTTSLFAPFTIPLLVKLFYGATVNVDVMSMFKQLALVIFVPFVLALLVRHFIPRVQKIGHASKPLSIFLLGLLIAGAVAQHSTEILSFAKDWWQLFVFIGGMYVFFMMMHVLGYFVFWWKSHDDKNTASITLTYMNFTLAIYLAAHFFPKPEVLLPLVFSILPWATLLPFWKHISDVFLKPSKR